MLAFIAAHWTDLALVATGSVTFACLMATKMPPPATASGGYYWIYSTVNAFAFSFGHAQNLSAPASTGIVGGAGATTGNALEAVTAVPLGALPNSVITRPVVTVGTTAKLASVLLLLFVLQACTAAQLATASKVFAAGQEFCTAATADGPLIVALVDAAGAPVIVTNIASAVVADACKAWNAAAIPVSPPAGASPATVPTVAIVKPTA